VAGKETSGNISGSYLGEKGEIIMAVLVKEEKSLKKQYRTYLIWTLILILGGISAIILGTRNIGIEILGLIAITLGSITGNQFLRFFLGSHGETKVTLQMAKLPDNYIIINDVTIPNGSRTAQIDHVLIADNGIFCIETKSHQGTIYGSETERNWKQVKSGGYTNEFYSPIKQCMTHTMALKTLLKNNGFNIFIQPIVVFTTDDTVLHITSKTPVLKAEQLPQYITEYTSNRQISDADKQKITEIIMQNSITERKGARAHTTA
jgi:hypothetical protein